MSLERITIKIMPGEVEAQVLVRSGPPTDRKSLDEALQAAGVVFGVDEEACEDVAGCLQDSDYEIDELVVARGSAPVRGKAGRLELQFNPELLAGRLRGDGTLDFRDRGLLAPVEPGEVIATYTPPTESRPGRSVEGRELAAEPPRDPLPTLAQGVELTESGEIRATMAGVVSFQENSILSVTSNFQHQGDVDLKSGNLQMEGSLVITGDLARNASAAATADLVVHGMVEGGTLRANGSVTVGGGVIGSETSHVVAGGDLACNHADGADLRCGGTLSIGANVIKSRLTARKIVVGKERGSVVGGELRAAESISLCDVGSKLSTRTVLAIGPIQDYSFPLEAGAKLGDTASRIRVVGTDADLLPRAVVQISGVAYPGVVIKLGPHELQIQDSVRSVRFVWDPDSESGIRMDNLRR